ncbi:MAG: hypothetical protein ACKOXS_07625, partial [Actinomycetes bacterium]
MRPKSDLIRTVAPFQVISEFSPAGDQPQAIDELEKRLKKGEKDIVLFGSIIKVGLWTLSMSQAVVADFPV